MKKLIFILLTIPMISLGQEFNSFKSSDVVVNHLLGKTIPYLKQKNKPKPIFNYNLNPQESIINWNDKKFIKWGIHNKDEIETISNIQMGSYNDSIHYDKDVNVVFLKEFQNNEAGYLIDMHYNVSDTLRRAVVFIGTDEQYEKSKYFWSSDTSINITLFGSQVDSSISLYAGGSNNGRGSFVSKIIKKPNLE
tara:strand:+ start:909 stop:1487 length:579 start_codon:yes stop_codon:yes gene_type:complete